MPAKIDRLMGITDNKIQILRKVKELGAALEEDLAVKLDRLGEDLRPDLEDLKQRKLLEVRTTEHDGEKTEIYLTARDIRDLL